MSQMNDEVTRSLTENRQIPSVHMVVRDRLKRLILRGELAAGTRLHQANLARSLGVSVTPVREALRDLAAVGLVDFDPFLGAVVHEPTAKELQEIYDIRNHLVPLAVEQGVVNIRKAELAEATRLLTQMEDESDPEQWNEWNREFHSIIDGACRNLQLTKILSQLHDASAIYVYYAMRYFPISHGNDDHRRLLEAYKHGDAEAALAIMRAHMKGTLDAAIRYLEEKTSAKAGGEGAQMNAGDEIVRNGKS
jgi:DNA-binding GntR family transcriptional regulator